MSAAFGAARRGCWVGVGTEVEYGSTSARGRGLCESWSRTSRSSRLRETCLPERAILIATAIPPTTSAAITMVVTAARMKWTTEPTIRNAIMMPPAMAAILNQLIRHPLDNPPETSSHSRYYLTGRVPPRDANTGGPLLWGHARTRH